MSSGCYGSIAGEIADRGEAAEVEPFVLYCSVCLFVREGVAERAVAVINGQSVCEDHMGYVQGEPHTRAIATARKEETRHE
jgi:hypothetical protein